MPTDPEALMNKSEKAESWVVYLMSVRNAEGMNAVCAQDEWDEMERARPGAQSLVQCGIASEGAASRLVAGVRPNAPTALPMAVTCASPFQLSLEATTFAPANTSRIIALQRRNAERANWPVSAGLATFAAY